MSNVKFNYYSKLHSNPVLIDLPEKLDNLEVNQKLLQSVFEIYRSNDHRSTAQTKTRGLVSGGGKKPWKQKGTGRARHGSSRSPIWSGGGITFGPSINKNYHRKINRKTYQLALNQIIKLATLNKRILIVDSIPVLKKTKEAALWLANQKSVEGNICIIDNNIHNNSIAFLNLPFVKLISSKSIKIDLLMISDYIIVPKIIIEDLIQEKIQIPVKNNQKTINKQAK